MKTAIITGVRGQDGSYLSEFLLDKGYRVVGMERRSSMPNYSNLKYVLNHKNFILEEGDITDAGSMARLVSVYKPDEFYNIAAQSFVGASWNQPSATCDVNFTGVCNCLEAIRVCHPSTKFFQASTSEVYGDVINDMQDENTPARPRSPYAAAKYGAESLIKVYRESYNIFACYARSFNHESVLKNTPIIIKDHSDEMIDILPIEDIFKSENHRYEGILEVYKGQYIWNGDSWTSIINGTCYQDKDKQVRAIQTVDSVVETTLDHYVFNENNKDLPNSNIQVGDRLFQTEIPNSTAELNSDINFAKFLGFVCGDGYVGDSSIVLTGIDKEQLILYAKLLTERFGFSYTIVNKGPGLYEGCKNHIFALNIKCPTDFCSWVRSLLYTKGREKKVPKFILNSSSIVKQAFFEGYYDADGRKAGHERYKYKGFTTSSATLCLGLIFLLNSFSDQKAKCKLEYKDGRRYYYVQLTCDRPTLIGKHLIKDKNEVIKCFYTKSDDGWFFDVQTTSETFATGPNLVKIHNSPRRGEQFVTRKITKWIGDAFAAVEELIDNTAWSPVNAVKNGRREYFVSTQEGFDAALQRDKILPLHLGNLSAKRDWSHAKDIVRGMWTMLQQDNPDDFVLASGEARSVEDFLSAAFGVVGVNDWKKFVVIDPKFYRPADVNLLCGDSSKARKVLGWSPEIPFDILVKEMVDHDIERATRERRGMCINV